MKIVFAYCLLLLAFYQIDCTTFNVSNESELNDALIKEKLIIFVVVLFWVDSETATAKTNE